MTHEYTLHLTDEQLQAMPTDVVGRLYTDGTEAMLSFSLNKLAGGKCAAGYSVVAAQNEHGMGGIDIRFKSGADCRHMVSRPVLLGDLAEYMPPPSPVAAAPAQTATDLDMQEYRNLRGNYADALRELQGARAQLDAANLRMMEATAQVDIAQVKLTEHATAAPDA